MSDLDYYMALADVIQVNDESGYGSFLVETFKETYTPAALAYQARCYEEAPSRCDTDFLFIVHCWKEENNA